MAIANISNNTKNEIINKSAKTLPTNPSARGMSADQIRKAFWAPVVESENSILTELDRVIKESNASFIAQGEAINAEKTAREEAIRSEEFSRIESIKALKTAEDQREENRANEEENYREEVATALAGKVDKESLDEDATHGTVAKRTKNGCLFAKTLDTIAGDDQLINRGYLEKQLSPIDPRLTALETGLSGKARSYVLEDLTMLSYALTGAWTFGDKSFYADALITGDNLLIVQKDVPDFWFEATTDETRTPDEYVYTDEFGVEQRIVLRVLGYDNGGAMVGLLHILESDYTVIEGYSKAASASAEEARESADAVRAALGDVGDLDAALDAILDLQASLIGGGV